MRRRDFLKSAAAFAAVGLGLKEAAKQLTCSEFTQRVFMGIDWANGPDTSVFYMVDTRAFTLDSERFVAYVKYYLYTERFDRSLDGDWSPRSPNTWQPRPRNMPLSSRYARKIRKLLGFSNREADKRERDSALEYVERHFKPGAAVGDVLYTATLYATQHSNIKEPREV